MYRVQAKIHAEFYTGETFTDFAVANTLHRQLGRMGIPNEVQVLLDDKDEQGADVWVRVGR